MKKINFYVMAFLCLSLSLSLTACGDDDDGGSGSNNVVFTKANNADPTLEANQDRITANVWLTRGNNQGLYNAASENSYSSFSSPADTEWAFGTTADLASLTFDNWEDTIQSDPIATMLNQDMVVHLITDDIYLDIKFTAWTIGQGGGGPGGGGFTYERSAVE